MDMSVSPDLEAFYCYGLVLLIGLLVAWSQVSKRLEKRPGKWIMGNTWLLFLSYALVPLILFWFLDRTNAVHDTSLFAAVLVGFGYQQILMGGLGGVRVSGDVSKFWKPFATWADSISNRIIERIKLNDSQFDERLLDIIRKDDKRFIDLKAVTMAHTMSLSQLDKLNDALEEIQNKNNLLGSDGVRAKQTSKLYESLRQCSSNPDQFQYLLYKNSITPKKWYFWYAKEWRSKTTAVIVALILLVSVASAVRGLGTPQNRARYYVWRLHKDNATDYDRFRAETKLREYLATTPSTCSQLINLLKMPNLSTKTADKILGLLVETRQFAFKKRIDLQALLVDALRTENSDIRTRIHKNLVYLAKDRGAALPPELENWQSDPKHSAIDIDKLYEQWTRIK